MIKAWKRELPNSRYSFRLAVMLMAVWTGSACFHGDDYNDGDGDNDGDEVIIVILE